MNAFAFGQLVGEKVAAQPMTAEAPMSNPAQAASTNKYLAMPGRNFLTSLARGGRQARRDANRYAAAAPVVGKLLGGAVGGNIGKMIGGLGGAAVGQQLRHVGGDDAVGYSAQPTNQPLPIGLRDGKLTNQPSQAALDLREDLGQTARALDAIAEPGPALPRPVDVPRYSPSRPMPQASPSAPKPMPPRGTGMGALKR